MIDDVPRNIGEAGLLQLVTEHTEIKNPVVERSRFKGKELQVWWVSGVSPVDLGCTPIYAQAVGEARVLELWARRAKPKQKERTPGVRIKSGGETLRRAATWEGFDSEQVEKNVPVEVEEKTEDTEDNKDGAATAASQGAEGKASSQKKVAAPQANDTANTRTVLTFERQVPEGLTRTIVPPDDNCLFTAIGAAFAHAMNRPAAPPRRVRSEAVAGMRRSWDKFKTNWDGKTPTREGEVCTRYQHRGKMQTAGTWGGVLELIHISCRYDLTVVTYPVNTNIDPIVITATDRDEPPVVLLWWTGCHYGWLTPSTPADIPMALVRIVMPLPPRVVCVAVAAIAHAAPIAILGGRSMIHHALDP